jgi:hypothetical protein
VTLPPFRTHLHQYECDLQDAPMACGVITRVLV